MTAGADLAPSRCIVDPAKPVVLVGCGKQKRTTDDPLGVAARDLYTSNLFASRRAYADRVSSSWFVLSARWGLLLPNELVKPYEASLEHLSDLDRAGWALNVAHDFVSQLPDSAKLSELRVELHAGVLYAAPLKGVLESLGCKVSWPVAGLGIGQQLHWYRHQAASVSP
jgi:hypothetical protein